MKWTHYLFLLLLISGGGYAAYKMTRGLRNKNPGNIRYNPANDWNGQVGKDDKDFVIFSHASYGIRAIGKTLDSYQRRGVQTIAQIISTWAPESENNTASYIRSVLSQMNIVDENYIPNRNDGDFLPLAKSIIRHENGFNPYSDDDIVDALNS